MLFKSENTRRKVTLVAGLLFFIGMSQSVITSFIASNPIAENTAQAVNNAPTTELDLESGYKIVLEREPENQTALQGLVNARMAKADWEGMIVPLDKLITLNPQEPRYVSLRETVDEQIAQASNTSQDLENISTPETDTP